MGGVRLAHCKRKACGAGSWFGSPQKAWYRSLTPGRPNPAKTKSKMQFIRKSLLGFSLAAALAVLAFTSSPAFGQSDAYTGPARYTIGAVYLVGVDGTFLAGNLPDYRRLHLYARAFDRAAVGGMMKKGSVYLLNRPTPVELVRGGQLQDGHSYAVVRPVGSELTAVTDYCALYERQSAPNPKPSEGAAGPV